MLKGTDQICIKTNEATSSSVTKTINHGLEHVVGNALAVGYSKANDVQSNEGASSPVSAFP